MTPSEAAEQFLTFYRGKNRVLLSFGPVGCDASRFTIYRHRDLGNLRDLDVPAWNPRGNISFSSYMEQVDALTREKGGVNYAGECRKHDLIGVLLINPGVIRVPERNDPRVSLETETGLRERFGVGDAALAVVLVGKDSREYGRYTPPVFLDDVLAHVSTLDDKLVQR